MAAIRAGSHPPGGGLVFALFTLVSRRGGTPCRARPARRSRHGVATGPALRPGNGTTFALEAQTEHRQLARGRDVHPGERRVALPLTGGGFFRRDDRLLALGQAGRGRGQALSCQMIRKSQACGSASSGGAVLLGHFIVCIFGIEV